MHKYNFAKQMKYIANEVYLKMLFFISLFV